MKYLIVIETTGTGFSAFSPDLDGCVATGATRDEVEQRMKEAIEFHLEGLRADGQPVPPPQSSSSYVDVPA
ncbi:MAG: type II toxin-antitoxin system HicB family antitoxin [Deltaproteobacteria bacterium]|nr:type II toxin-antitoxin system HicB family antitoxin [Deltaproteobacteria bacterium]